MHSQPVIISGAAVHDGLGNVWENYDVRIENGRFSEIGKALAGSGCRFVDAAGLEMFPGFVVPLSPWGGAGPALSSGSLSERSSLLTPELDVSYAFQADSIAYQRLYQWGITTTCLTPDFTNILSGSAAVYKSYADSLSGYLLRDKAFMAASFTDQVKTTHAGKRYSETDMGLIHLFREALETGISSESAAWKKVLSGDMPLVVCCDSRSMWRRILQVLEDYPAVRCGLCGVYGIREEDLQRAGEKVPFIHFSIADAGWQAQQQIDYQQLDIMLGARFPIAVSPYHQEAEMAHAESVLWNACAMYKNGVNLENIVKSLTSIPAEILGKADRVGSIAAGKDADFSLWSGHPFTSFKAQMEQVWIDGSEVTDREVTRYCW